MNMVRFVTSVLLWMLLTAPAIAQGSEYAPWAPGYEVPLESAVRTEDVDFLKLKLACSEEQSTSIEALFAQHREQFAAFVAESKPIIAEQERQVAEARKQQGIKTQALGQAQVDFSIHPGGDPDIVRTLEAAAQEASRKFLESRIDREAKLATLADKQHELDESFFASLEPVLTKEQQERLPIVRQGIKRRAWLGTPFMFGESGIDLIALLEKVAEEQGVQDENTDLDELLQSYESQAVQLLEWLAGSDIAYARRNYRDHEEAGHWVVTPGSVALVYGEDAKYMKEFEQRHATRLRKYRELRDLNRNTKPAVVALMPESLREPFERVYMERAMRSYVRLAAMPGLPFAKSALELSSLTTQQRKDIENLIEAHAADSAVLVDRLLRTGDALAEGNYAIGVQPKQREELKNQYDAVRESYRKAEVAFIEIVWSILTADQQSLVWKPSLEKLPR